MEYIIQIKLWSEAKWSNLLAYETMEEAVRIEKFLRLGKPQGTRIRITSRKELRELEKFEELKLIYQS